MTDFFLFSFISILHLLSVFFFLPILATFVSKMDTRHGGVE